MADPPEGGPPVARVQPLMELGESTETDTNPAHLLSGAADFQTIYNTTLASQQLRTQSTAGSSVSTERTMEAVNLLSPMGALGTDRF